MARTSLSFAFPVALVTRASVGTGEAASFALLTAGYRVFGTDRKELPYPSGAIRYLRCDVSSDESIVEVVGEVLKTSKCIDLRRRFVRARTFDTSLRKRLGH